MIRLNKYIIVLLALMLSVSAYSQNDGYTLNQLRAGYVYTFPKFITWEREEEIKKFTIGVFTSETEIYKELKSMAKLRNIKDKQVVVVRFYSLEDIIPTQIIYIGNEYKEYLGSIMKEIEKSNTLIVTDNIKSGDMMINFIYDNKTKNFEVNEKNLIDAGLIFSDKLTEYATSETNWRQLYIESGKMLEKEKETVETQKKVIEQQMGRIEDQQQEIEWRREELNTLIDEIAEQANEVELQKLELRQKQEEMDEYAERIKAQEERLNTLFKKNAMQKIIIVLSGLFALVVLVMVFFIFRAYKLKKKANALLREQKEYIDEKNEELEVKNNMLQNQRDQITQIHGQMTDSIEYALRIQQAMLPSQKELSAVLKEYFVIYKPKDIVSGDFYLADNINGWTILAVGDCTGHGVPGAFMSIMGITFLHGIIRQKDMNQTNLALERLRTYIIDLLRQKAIPGEHKDGMDISLCAISPDKKTLHFTGAHHSIYVARNNQLEEYKGDRQPIGITKKVSDLSFNEIEVQENDIIYLFSDGFADQPGGEAGKKMKVKQFKELVHQNMGLPLAKQKENINLAFENWISHINPLTQKPFLQIDDVCVFAVKV